jgi:hypothetical protein
MAPGPNPLRIPDPPCTPKPPKPPPPPRPSGPGETLWPDPNRILRRKPKRG